MFVKGARRLVSRDKHRFCKDGFDLDLTYILDRRLIAMGIPACALDKTWRNDIGEVKAFFLRYHPDRFLIFDLSGLHSYDPSHFSHRVVEAGWPDHHPPPFELLHAVVLAMHRFYHQHPDHCVAVHCLAGRGRTGTVIACFLLFERLQPSPQAAVHCFCARRSQSASDISGPSQLRYVEYYHRFLRGEMPPSFASLRTPARLVIRFARFSCAPFSAALAPRFVPLLKISMLSNPDVHILVHPQDAALSAFPTAAVAGEQPLVLPFPPSSVIAGDLEVKLFHRCEDVQSFSAMTTFFNVPTASKFPNIFLGRFCFNTDFIVPDEHRHASFRLDRYEFDAVQAGAVPPEKFPPNFSLQLSFTLLPLDSPELPMVGPSFAKASYSENRQYPSVSTISNVLPWIDHQTPTDIYIPF